MTQDHHILVLGGSAEARLLAEALTMRGISYSVWLSEAPRGPAPLPQVPQLRRFEESAQMQAEIARLGCTALLDASHCFDHHATVQGFAAAQALKLPFLRVERPAWDVPRQWRARATVAQAVELIPDRARVFCATGWDSLPAFAGFRGEVLMLRQTRRHERPAPYPFVELIFGDPPFDQPREEALFTQLRVDLLICRNIGGAGSRPKLDAAQALGLDVIVIDRPALPEGIEVVQQTGAALDWLAAL